jgi:hypothetical protein
MKTDGHSRIRDTVYVVGAGFSAGLGYPPTKSLLIDAWGRLPKAARHQLRKIIESHHPNFTRKQNTTFPDIEQLLTEMAVNLQMFEASRPAEGRFTKDQLKESREILLFTIAAWFHEIYEDATAVVELYRFAKSLGLRLPLLYVEVPVVKKGFLAFDSSVRPIKRKANGIATQLGMVF